MRYNEEDSNSNKTQSARKVTYLKSMTSVPTRLATLVLAKATDMRRTELAVARLKRTRTSRNFQNVATSGTRPTSRYTIAPKTSGGTTLRGKMSKSTCEANFSDHTLE